MKNIPKKLPEPVQSVPAVPLFLLSVSRRIRSDSETAISRSLRTFP